MLNKTEATKDDKSLKGPIERPNDFERIVFLEFPIQLGNPDDPTATLAKITLKRPKVKDLLALGKQSGTEDERQIRLMAALSTQQPSVLEELYASDWERLNKAFEELRFPPELLRAD